VTVFYAEDENGLVEDIARDYVNDGFSEHAGRTTIWEVDLPPDIIKRLKEEDIDVF